MPSYSKLESDVTKREAEVLSFWESRQIFRKSLEKTQNGQRYVFYEGPPTANGKAHFGHLMPRVYKDLFPRYKTMRGFYVLRKGGWDTHGLPVELEVEKALGLNSKQDIEKYGVEKFAQKCKESVWQYKSDWERLIQRMGFWIDLENAYITYTNEYVESVWWALKRIWDQDLLYKGHKVLPYCPRCGTPLSSHEVAQGYDEVTDPAITVKFKLTGRENEYVLAWTTTPWTLPGNVALAVGDEIEYAKVQQGDEIYYLAEERVAHVLEDEYQVLASLKGSEMDGWEYEPLFPFLKDALGKNAPRAWFVTATSGMVSTEEGSGVVHTAVMYGEEDYELGERLGLPKHHTVDMNGRFTSEVKPWAGVFVKDADREIIRTLKKEGKLYKSENYTHTYPFCWRCDTPLLYYALDSWFIKTTARQKEIIANNQQVNWHPEHMRDGRFGNFLETMKDWALSRDRYWGTPLPIWICEACNHQLCVGSRSELKLSNLAQLAGVDLHKPYIDEVKLSCPQCEGQMSRVPQVIDTWFDSGMMHTAQWHAPFENEKLFNDQFPAEFICEGMDQTRGWFYTLLVTSTLLYPDRPYPHPYRHVVVTGMGLDAEGKKMSKSRGNVLDPMDFVNDFGADALRWYLYSESAPWRDRPLSKEEAGKVLHSFINTITNVYNFFALYAPIDGFDPRRHQQDVHERPLLDCWMVSRYEKAVQTVTQSLDAYDVVAATGAIEALIDDLSNWYVRVSRPRFWGEEAIGDCADKQAAYSTLYEVLIALSKLLAPFMPFLAEAMYHLLRQADMPESVHLCDWPKVQDRVSEKEVEEETKKKEKEQEQLLVDEMKQARHLATSVLQARNKSKIKVRQPLRCVFYQLKSGVKLQNPSIIELVKREVNVKELVEEDLLGATSQGKYGEYDVWLKKDSIGRAYGRLLPDIEKYVLSLPHKQRIAEASSGILRVPVDGRVIELVLDQDYSLNFKPHPSYMGGHDGPADVILVTTLDDELRQEGYIREFAHHVQELRKKAGFEVTDRIEIFFDADAELAQAIAAHTKHVQDETLAIALHDKAPNSNAVDHMDELNVNGLKVRVGLKRVH